MTAGPRTNSHLLHCHLLSPGRGGGGGRAGFRKLTSLSPKSPTSLEGQVESYLARGGGGSWERWHRIPQKSPQGLPFRDGALDGGGGTAFGISRPLDLVWGDIPLRKNSQTERRG